MLFNSLDFIVFFPMVVALYFMLPHRFRWVLLIIASYYFYMCWNYKYVVLIFITTIINYLCGIGIGRSRRKSFKILFLTTGLLVSFGILFFYKYFNFFGESVNVLFDQFNIFYKVPAYDVLLPVGISFFTFQTLSYTIDVYKGNQHIEYHLGIFALYVSFFPQLVAGPIERSTNLLPQFRKENHLTYENIRDGIVQMLWGFFKKVVIADRLSEYVNTVYNTPGDYQGPHFLLATLFFSFQIYCDFSGYSDIAIGTARILGYRLMVNFRRPYMAASIREFWQRWHISLSTWFRDYLYIALGGNRVASKWRYYFNLFFTFLVSGLWHGANWTFVIWGALHGLYLVFAIWIKTWREKFNNALGLTSRPGLHLNLQRIITFFLAYFAWIFFRANTLDDAIFIIGSMPNLNFETPLNLFSFPVDFYICIFLILLLIIIEILEERYELYARLRIMPARYKWALVTLITLALFILGVWEASDFLYFQF
ncbi:MAG TPA: MBOAT family O-acyltransferase [Bacteroidales bacterium]|nr:MBOAT family O-acyltransferase [Bacteroidales bacterium]